MGVSWVSGVVAVDSAGVRGLQKYSSQYLVCAHLSLWGARTHTHTHTHTHTFPCAPPAAKKRHPPENDQMAALVGGRGPAVSMHVSIQHLLLATS